MKFRKNRGHLLALACLSVGGFGSTTAFAQSGVEELEEIIVTGARGRPRTVADSPVPVDVFSAADLEAVSYTDMNDVVKTLVPSYNVSRQPISDGATFIRPASLRGMPTDKTLVLINSKRRHRSALVAIGGSGTQGPDIATIPTSAIKNVEVLRDGAAAQYGSDAIAGVINFILKDASEGASLTIDGGEFSEADGTSSAITGNIGLPLGNTGFLSISAELSEADATTRAEQYCESWFCVDPTLPDYNPNASYAQYVTPEFLAGVASANIGPGDVVQPWGQPNTEAARLFFNAGFEIDADTEAYAFGNYSRSETDGGFFYRYPKNGTIEDLRTPDGSIYSPLEKFPGGFTPRFFGEVFDMSLVGGIRGEWDSGLTYDFSARGGESEVDYTLKNTVNPSMGPASPTSFRPGDLINTELQFQADFTYEFGDSGMASPVLLAFGASYMDESYEVVGGGESSYIAGPYAVPDPWDFCNADGTATEAGATVIAGGSTLDCADSSDPAFKVVGVGSNGFPGYSPQFSDLYERDSFAIYGDLSADVTDSLFLQAALRYEDYSDFDSELVGKVAGRLNLNDDFALRGSFGTGFRAPTPGQQGTINVSTRLPNGFPVATGLFPAGGPVARALGSSPLEPETSTNYTLGLTGALGALDFTLDFYRIDMEDRTNAVSTRDVSTDPTSGDDYLNYIALRDAGVAGAETIGGVFYFANAFDTKTTGMDIVATYPIEWGDAGTTDLTVSLNYNETEFESDPSAYLNAENQYDFENEESNWRGVFTAKHSIGDLTLIGRANYYGEYANSNNSSNLVVQTFDPIVLTDIEAQYRVNEMFKVSLGGRNVFDEYPERDNISDYCCGRIYSSGTSVSWQGSYYYMRLTADF